MNKEIASILRDRLLTLPVIELFCGLVYTQHKRDRVYSSEEDDKGFLVDKRFPATCDYYQNGTRCENYKLIDVVPNSKLRGILYFEDNGVSIVSNGYSSKLRLIVWLNSSYVSANCVSISTPFVSKIIQLLTGNPFNAGNMIKIDVRVSGIPNTSSEIFSRYTYDEATTQYLMPPFEYFAIDFDVRFGVLDSCISEISLNDPSCTS